MGGKVARDKGQGMRNEGQLEGCRGGKGQRTKGKGQGLGTR